MATRILTRSLLCAALALIAAASQGRAQQLEAPLEQPSKPARVENQLIERLYPVADLVTPINEAATVDVRNLVKLSEFEKQLEPAPADSAAGAPKTQPLSNGVAEARSVVPAKTREDELITLLTTCVDPENWAGKGGRATIAYHSGCMTLAVHALPAHQEKIAAVLAGLRRQQETEVSVETRIITVSDAFLQRLGLELGTPVDATLPAPTAMGSIGMVQRAAKSFPRVTFFDDAQVRQFMDAIQGDQRTNVMQTPKITVFNGQKAKFSSAETSFFVTNVDVKKVGGQDVYVPRNEVLPTSGVYFALQPTISADQRFVSLDLKANIIKQTSASVPLFPITTFITPVFEGGAVGQPVPFTQFVQQPSFTNLAVDRKLNLPDGGTALLSGWRVMSEGKNEFAPPVLSKVPYLNRLFKNVGYSNEPMQVMIMVTPRIIRDSETETRSVLAHQVSKMRTANPSAPECEPLPELLAKYRQACSENRLTDAQALAAKALLLDPACFNK